MKIAVCIASCIALLAHTTSAQATEQRIVRAKLMHGGYLKKDGAVLLQEGTDQAWAAWTYRACRGEPGPRTYIRRDLVHSLTFPKPGGIYMLTLNPEGQIESVARADPHANPRC